MIDSKGRNFGCLVPARAKRPGLKEKREQAPARQTQFYTVLSIAGNTRKSRIILVAVQFTFCPLLSRLIKFKRPRCDNFGALKRGKLGTPFCQLYQGE